MRERALDDGSRDDDGEVDDGSLQLEPFFAQPKGTESKYRKDRK